MKCRLRAAVFTTVVGLLLIFAAGCVQPTVRCHGGQGGQVAVMASVFRGVYKGSPTRIADEDDIEYVVVVTAFNSGRQPLLCDDVTGHFYSKRPGTLVLRPLDEADEDFILQPGQTKTYEFKSNGFTTDLIQRSKGRLLFAVTFKQGGANIVGPLSAPLPHILTLPKHRFTTSAGYQLDLRCPLFRAGRPRN